MPSGATCMCIINWDNRRIPKTFPEGDNTLKLQTAADDYLEETLRLAFKRNKRTFTPFSNFSDKWFHFYEAGCT
jgi:hypothetical protein